MINARKIVIFKGIIDSLDAFAEELMAGLEKEGADVLMINVNDLHYFQDELFNRINEYVSHKDTIVIFMNSVGMLMDDISGGNYWNKSGVKCFDILADPPFFYHNAIESDIENVTFVCVDKEQSDYINRYYGIGSEYYKKHGRVRKSLYMPLAGVQSHILKNNTVSDNNISDNIYNNSMYSNSIHKDDAYENSTYENDALAFNNREYDVIFTGSIRDYEDIDTQVYNLDDSLKEMWDVVLGYICEDTSLTIERAIRKCMTDYSLNLTDEHVNQIILLFKKMDSVIRALHRQRVITAIADGGVKIDVFGDGWDVLKRRLTHPENLIIHDCVSYRESVDIAAKAKISVNVMPWFKTGFHDRIATAMLNGCVSVTDQSSYINDNYTDGKDIVIYSLDNLSALAEKITTLLENKDNSTYRLAMAGRNKAIQSDTWHERAKWFLTL